MTVSRRATFENLRTVASSTLNTVTRVNFGLPIQSGALVVKVQNPSTQDIFISDDAANDKDVIIAGSYAVYDIGTNGQTSDNSERLCFPGGTQFSLRGTAGTGTVYMTVITQTRNLDIGSE